jgi:hypothetical protein
VVFGGEAHVGPIATTYYAQVYVRICLTYELHTGLVDREHLEGFGSLGDPARGASCRTLPMMQTVKRTGGCVCIF